MKQAKSKPRRLFGTLFCLSIFCAPLFAERLGGVKEQRHKESDDPYFGGILDYGFSLNGLNFIPSNKVGFDGKTGLEAAFILRYRSRYSVMVSYGRYHMDVNDSDETLAGKATITPILAQIQYSYPLTYLVVPFVRGGGGVAQVSNESRPAYFFDLPLRQTFDDEAMFAFGAGVNIFPLKSNRFSIEVSYSRIYFSPDTTIIIHSDGEDFVFRGSGVDMGGDMIRLGAQYFF